MKVDADITQTIQIQVVINRYQLSIIEVKTPITVDGISTATFELPPDAKGRSFNLKWSDSWGDVVKQIIEEYVRIIKENDAKEIGR